MARITEVDMRKVNASTQHRFADALNSVNKIDLRTVPKELREVVRKTQTNLDYLVKITS